jgi:hypothetical protein
LGLEVTIHRISYSAIGVVEARREFSRVEGATTIR